MAKKKDRRQVALEASSYVHEMRRPPRPEHNNPVSEETFDRERMGIAAKE